MEELIILFAGILCLIFIGFGIAVFHFFFPEPPPPPLTPQQVWAENWKENCKSQGGRFAFDEKSGWVNCHRTVFYRRDPKLLFKEQWKEPGA